MPMEMAGEGEEHWGGGALNFKRFRRHTMKATGQAKLPLRQFVWGTREQLVENGSFLVQPTTPSLLFTFLPAPAPTTPDVAPRQPPRRPFKLPASLHSSPDF